MKYNRIGIIAISIFIVCLCLCVPVMTQTWAKTYNPYGGGALWAIQQTSDGGYITGGRTQDMSFSDYILLKLDSSGSPLWSNSYDLPGI